MTKYLGNKSIKLVHLLACLILAMFATSSLIAATKMPVKIVKIILKDDDCVKKGGTIIVVLDKKITRGVNHVTITGGKKIHHHAKIEKWGLRSSAIHVKIPKDKTFREGQKLRVMIERRVPHKQASNKRKIKICYGHY